MKRIFLPALLAAGMATVLWACASDIIENDDGSVAKEALISWSATSVSAVLGQEFESPGFSNPNDLPVSFSSSNTAVATVDAAGAVSLKGIGYTEISAEFEGNDSFLKSKVSYSLTVSSANDSPDKEAARIAWPEDTYVAVLGEEFSSPVLSNPNSLAVRYSSSNGDVADVDPSTGDVTVKAAGVTTVSATWDGDETYNSAVVSYSLRVRKSSGDGSGEYTFDKTDSDDSDDNIALTVFDRWITVTFSDADGASVDGDSEGYVTVDGNKVSVNNGSDEKIIYELIGKTSDGCFKIESSSRKQAIFLNGVSITNKNGAAVNNQSHKRTFLKVEGVNSLADGPAYDTPSGEDEKAAIFSEGQLVFSGSGTLTVTATGKAGITSDDYVRFMGSPTVRVSSSAGHAVRGKEAVTVSSGTIEATATADMKKGFSSDSLVRFEGGKTTLTVSGNAGYDSEEKDYSGSAGVKADKLFEMTGGTVTIKNSGTGGKGIKVGSSAEKLQLKESFVSGGTLEINVTGNNYTAGDISSKGIKIGWAVKSGHTYSSKSGDFRISGGTVKVTSSRSEAIEIKGDLNITGGEVYAFSEADDAINAAGDFTVTDGHVCGISTSNDGLDANGDLRIKGGIVYAAGGGGAELAIDANSEAQKKLYLEGGTVFALGGLESRFSTSGVTCKSSNSVATGTWYSLTVGNSTYAFKTPSSCKSPLVVAGTSSSISMKSDVTVSGGTSILNGYGLIGAEISKGSNVSLGSYSGGGGPGGGRW